MKVRIHFFQVNSDFSIEHAEAHHQGQESENNLKYDWEDEFEISQNLKAVEILRKDTFTLQGQFPDGNEFLEQIPNMCLVALHLEDGQTGFMGVSESMLIELVEEGTANEPVVKFYIKDYEPCWNEMPGVFIAAKEFPKNIKLNDID